MELEVHATTSMTIRHVPVGVRNELASRAARRGQSLQEFVLGELATIASKPSVDDWLAQVRSDTAGTGRRIDRDALLADLDVDRR